MDTKNNIHVLRPAAIIDQEHILLCKTLDMVTNRNEPSVYSDSKYVYWMDLSL